MDFVMAEEDPSFAGGEVAEVVNSELTSLHSGVGGAFGTGRCSCMVIETLVVVVGGRRYSALLGWQIHWHVQGVLMVVWAQEILHCRRIYYEEPGLDLDLVGTKLDHSSRWRACHSGRCGHSGVVEAAMGLAHGGRCWSACISS
jgi:hypothetical protein